MYVIPPEQSAEFVSHMEDVLEIYHLLYDPKVRVICMDEQPIQLIKETRIPQDLRNCHKQWRGYTAPRAKQLLHDKHGNSRTFELLN